MKLNKKGFTLIELLAVVVILLAISMIAITSISAAIDRNKKKQDDARKANLISYGKLYYDAHKNSWDGCMMAYELQAALNLTEDEVKDSDGNYLGGVSNQNGSFEYVDSCN